MLPTRLVFLFLLSIRAIRSDTEPAPIVVNPSGNFFIRYAGLIVLPIWDSLGNDGNWSTFAIGVGSPPQVVQLLPSSKVPETWVVLVEGCTNEPKNCSDIRGGLFNYNLSTTWNQKGIYALGSEANLGYTTNSDNGAYAWQNLTWATSNGANVTVNHTVIAGIATTDFYLGSLENAPGSLTLGGYDASRLKPNDVSFSFLSQLQRQLSVPIQGISVTNSMANSELLTEGIYALVDSTVPHLWLPLSVCQAFEDALGIVFDPITTLYLVNDTQHDALLKQNAEVTFSLATSLNGGSVINITLPYASFDLEADYPLVNSRRRYFPLRRAKDETQYTLGRVLLQEAFLIVDYDHNSFSISQAQYTEGTPSHVVATTSTTGTGTTNSNNNTTTTSDNPSIVKSSSHASHGIGTGAIAGIAVAIIVLAVAAAGFCFWKFKHRKSKKGDKNLKGKAELDGNGEHGGIDEAYGKRRPSQESVRETKKGTSVNVNEVVRTPPAETAELEGVPPFGGPSRAQKNLDQPLAELPSPDPSRHELEPSMLGILRSELSTPEPPSELSTADPSLVPELTSHEMPHELSGSNRQSRVRPHSHRNSSLDSEILPQDSASIRPTLHNRKGSDDTLSTPISPQPQRPSLRQNQRRHSGFQRPPHSRLNSQSSHDTFETRFNEPSSTPQPHHQGVPSPLASPPLSSQPSPRLSALNSPTFPHQQMSYPGPPTPGFDITEKEPLISSQQPQQEQQAFRSTRFLEGFTADPAVMTNEESQRRDEAKRVVVKEEVEKLEDRVKKEGD
ncbi:MAG: hypothetical protein Q9225_006076 [Loekoesia sp. 1 TL-2023]